MAKGDNTFPTDSARGQSVLNHHWKKMINDIRLNTTLSSAVNSSNGFLLDFI